MAACAQRKSAKQSCTSKSAAGKSMQTTESRRTHVFNMLTYKLHALGDYVEAIQMYGTTDN